MSGGIRSHDARDREDNTAQLTLMLMGFKECYLERDAESTDWIAEPLLAKIPSPDILAEDRGSFAPVNHSVDLSMVDYVSNFTVEALQC